jgi:hypothetical protein
LSKKYNASRFPAVSWLPSFRGRVLQFLFPLLLEAVSFEARTLEIIKAGIFHTSIFKKGKIIPFSCLNVSSKKSWKLVPAR